MPMQKPRLCAVISRNNMKCVETANNADLIEVRIDMIGDRWQSLPKMLKRPWIACNRIRSEGGFWNGSESERVRELLEALDLGASYIDIELKSTHLKEVVQQTKRAERNVIISYHDTVGTPTTSELKKIVDKEIRLGADICKLVTTATSFEDNLTILKLVHEYASSTHIVAFCMGEKGSVSRILSPLIGGELVYVSTKVGLESASGQIELESLRTLYQMLESETERQKAGDKT